MHAYRRVFASAIAASGSSNAPGHRQIVIASFATPASVERFERTARAQIRDAAVEARDDDADGAAVAERRALEHGVAVGDVDLAAHVLDADVGGDLLDHARRSAAGQPSNGVAVGAARLERRPRAPASGSSVVLRLLLAFVDVGHSGSGS